MDLARIAPAVTDLESGLLDAYPLLVRRLALVLRDASEAEDLAQAAFTRALEQRHRFAVVMPARGYTRSVFAWRSTSCAVAGPIDPAQRAKSRPGR